MALSSVRIFKEGQEAGSYITKQLGTRPIRFSRELEIDFPPGFAFLLPRTLKNIFEAWFRPVRSVQDIDRLMRRSRGICVWNAEVAVSIPERNDVAVDTCVAKNFNAAAFLGRFSVLHAGRVILKTDDGIVVNHKHGKAFVTRVAMHGRQQRYSYRHNVREESLMI